jgi:hypothetical protein
MATKPKNSKKSPDSISPKISPKESNKAIMDIQSTPAGNSNSVLRKANKDKKDEFYTQLSDIEKEMKNYKSQFKGKTIYCNCDDPYESNFFKYFAMNFNALGLKKLITTSYVGSPIAGGQLSLFDLEGLKPSGKQPFKIEICEVPDLDGDGAIGLALRGAGVHFTGARGQVNGPLLLGLAINRDVELVARPHLLHVLQPHPALVVEEAAQDRALQVLSARG